MGAFNLKLEAPLPHHGRDSDPPRPDQGVGSFGIPFCIAEIRPVRPQLAVEQFHARIAPNNAMTLSGIDWL
jgi:hypothetical protein